MRNILAKELKIKFVETLSSIDGFTYGDGNPFLIKIYGETFFIFLKNLSPAYFKNSPDVTRVQLPFSDHFDKINNANIQFIILGYDVDNDTMVSWNPSKIKERLNTKSNVSLYSRNTLQSGLSKYEIKTGYLSNGEKIILFRRENLGFFFKSITNLFEEIQVDIKNTGIIVNDLNKNYYPEKIFEIVDIEILNMLNPLLEKNRVLEAVEICIKFYHDKYKKMTFKEWFDLINILYKNKI